MKKKIIKINICLLTLISILYPNVAYGVNKTFTANYYLENPHHKYQLKESITYSTDKTQVDKEVIKDYTGYKLKGYETPVINSDCSTTCDVYYDLCYYNLEIDYGNYKEYQYLYYNEPVELTTPNRDDYTFIGWDTPVETMPSHDVTISALYSRNSDAIIVAYYLENAEDDDYSLAKFKSYHTLNTTPEYDGDDASYFTFDHQNTSVLNNTTIYALYYKRHHYHLKFNLTIDGDSQYFYSTNAFRCTLTSGDIGILVNNKTYYNTYTVDVKYHQSLAGLWPSSEMILNNPEGRVFSDPVHYLYKVGNYTTSQTIVDEQLVEGYSNNDLIVMTCYWTSYKKSCKLRYFFDDGNGYKENTDLTEYVYNPIDKNPVPYKTFNHYDYISSQYHPLINEYCYYYKRKSFQLTLVDNEQYHSYILDSPSSLSSYLYTPSKVYKIFTGWFDVKGNQYRNTDTINADLALYARYEDKVCHVNLVDENNNMITSKNIQAGSTLKDLLDTKKYDYFLIDDHCINPEKYIVIDDTTIVAIKKEELFTDYVLHFKDESGNTLLPDIKGIVKTNSTHSMEVNQYIDQIYECDTNIGNVNKDNDYTYTFIYKIKTVTLTLTNLTDDLQDEDQHFVCHLINDAYNLTFTLTPDSTVEIVKIPAGSYTFKDDNEIYTHYSTTLDLYDDQTLVLEYKYTGNHRWKTDTGKML